MQDSAAPLLCSREDEGDKACGADADGARLTAAEGAYAPHCDGAGEYRPPAGEPCRGARERTGAAVA